MAIYSHDKILYNTHIHLKHVKNILYFLQSKKGLKYVGTSAPGPGVYSLPNTLRTQSDFNRSEVGRLFQKPIAQATELEKKEKRPAPNQYQVIKTLKCFVCMFVCVLEGVLLFISCYYFERT